MKRIIGVLIVGSFVLIFFLPPAVHSEDEPVPPPSIRIKLATAGEDSLKDRLSWCLEEEFKRIDDVEIVANNEDWKLSVVVSQVSSLRGHQGDIAFSVLILKPYNIDPVSEDDAGALQREDENYLQSGAPYIVQDQLLMAGYPNLQSGCRNIAADFAKQYLGKSSQNKIKRY